MFNKAIDWGHSRTNPVNKVDRLKVPRRHPEFYEIAEVAQLLQAARQSENAQDYGLVCLAVNTGMRREEILHLEWSDVDLLRSVVRVQPKEAWNTKTGKPRSIPLSLEALEALKAHPRHFGCSWVFWIGNGQRMKTPQGYERAVKRAGIRRLRFHDLRHTFASHMVMTGVGILTVGELLGHQSIAMTQVYAHLAPAHMEAAIRRLSYQVDTPVPQKETGNSESP